VGVGIEVGVGVGVTVGVGVNVGLGVGVGVDVGTNVGVGVGVGIEVGVRVGVAVGTLFVGVKSITSCIFPVSDFWGDGTSFETVAVCAGRTFLEFAFVAKLAREITSITKKTIPITTPAPII